MDIEFGYGKDALHLEGPNLKTSSLVDDSYKSRALAALQTALKGSSENPGDAGTATVSSVSFNGFRYFLHNGKWFEVRYEIDTKKRKVSKASEENIERMLRMAGRTVANASKKYGAPVIEQPAAESF